MSSSVGVVTITINQRDLTQGYLEEIARQSYHPIKLYLVDNGSRDEERLDDIVAVYDWVEYIYLEENTGFTGGNNVGIRQALQERCDYIWLLNNDVRLEPSCLDKMVSYLDAHPEVGAVSPKIYYDENPSRLWYAGGRIDWSRPFPFSLNSHYGEYEVDRGQFDQLSEVDFITGCSILVRHEVFERVGLLDEKYFLYFEDADFSLRVKRSGYQLIYLPSAVMWHMVGLASGGILSPSSSYYQIRSWLLFIKKWASPQAKLLAAFYAVTIIMRGIIKIIIPSKRKFAALQVRAVRDFVQGRFGRRQD